MGDRRNPTYELPTSTVVEVSGNEIHIILVHICHLKFKIHKRTLSFPLVYLQTENFAFVTKMIRGIQKSRSRSQNSRMDARFLIFIFCFYCLFYFSFFLLGVSLLSRQWFLYIFHLQNLFSGKNNSCSFYLVEVIASLLPSLTFWKPLKMFNN